MQIRCILTIINNYWFTGVKCQKTGSPIHRIDSTPSVKFVFCLNKLMKNLIFSREVARRWMEPIFTWWKWWAWAVKKQTALPIKLKWTSTRTVTISIHLLSSPADANFLKRVSLSVTKFWNNHIVAKQRDIFLEAMYRCIGASPKLNDIIDRGKFGFRNFKNWPKLTSIWCWVMCFWRPNLSTLF